MNAGQLTCNYAKNPLGIETPFPVFNWSIEGDGYAEVQTAYRIVVASNAERLAADEGDVWDTGDVSSDQSCGIRFAGSQLYSAQRCWWKVRVSGRDGAWSPWSHPAWFETGLLKQTDWRARWICLSGPNVNGLPDTSRPAPFFRKTVLIARVPASVRVYVSGLGYYELYVNGAQCGEAILSPAVSHYDRTVYYDTHDVTGQLQVGENVVGVVLGNGWYNTFTSDVWDFQKAAWRHVPKLLLQLEITYEDGAKDTVGTDSTWKVTSGPIQFDGIRNGEHYDARQELDGWNLPGWMDAQWDNAQITRAPGGTLKSAQLPAIKEIEELEPVSVVEVEPGTHVFDFGKNISGWGKLQLSAPSGSEVTIEYGERLDKNGKLDTEEIELFIKSGDFQTDKYIARGAGIETWHPRFTYHGFQYIQATGLERADAPVKLHAGVVHTALPDAGAFECSNLLLNRIQEAARRSTLTNYHSFPTDCPHREKNGWTGDALLSAEQVLLNFDPVTAYRKWMLDFTDVQRPSGQIPGIVPSAGWGFNWGSGPAWDSALILIPWYTYVYSADRGILETTYDAMVRYLGFLESMETEGIVDFGLGDWCPPAEESWQHKCPTAVTDTAYAYVDFLTVSRIAELLGRPNDASRFSAKAADIRAAFRSAFIDVRTGSVAGDSQTSLACALYQGLVDEHEKPMILRRLIDEVEKAGRHLDTGILGTKYLLHTLSQHGRTDLAYAVATQTDYPSWGHWIEQGATTLWERWDGKSSRNHHMYSDISAWFYRELAGLQPDPREPGFKHIMFKPNPVEGLSWAKAQHVSPHGRVESGWAVDDGMFRLEIEVPVNCRGTVFLPTQFSEDVRLNGVKLARAESEKRDAIGRYLFKVGSGRYEVIAKHS
ncbi:MAG TPA: family 78 glycoside hydrolase catalytic domain [Spirochaetia bacterium]|nr:family 78 glycoside hydrolase catalytic domain [Spirochaetia bacterium]